MAKLSDKRKREILQDLKVFNPNNYAKAAGKGTPFIIFFADTSRERGGRSARFQVIRIGYKTDPKSHWQDYGYKTFNVWSSNTKDDTRAKAIEWAEERYGVKMVKGPWRESYFPEDVVKDWDKKIAEAIA